MGVSGEVEVDVGVATAATEDDGRNGFVPAGAVAVDAVDADGTAVDAANAWYACGFVLLKTSGCFDCG